MNPPTLSTVWLHVLALLAIEVGVAALATAAVARCCVRAAWRRNIYQVGILALLIITLFELSGWGRELAGRMVGGLALKPKAGERQHAERKDGSAVQSATAVFQGQNKESSSPHLPLALSSSSPPARPPVLESGRRLENKDPFLGSVLADHMRSRSVAASVERQSQAKSYGASEASDSIAVLCLWLIWAVGATLVAGRALAGRCLFLLFRSRRRAVTEPQLLEKISKLARPLGLRRPVRVVESARLKGPIAFGLTHPTIGLPLGFSTQFDGDSQSVILAHELAHLAAHDTLWHTLADLAAALLWWHPAVWWTRRQLRVASELAADDASLLVADGPGVLAKCLLELGSRLTQTPLMGELSVSGFRSHLGRRIQRLLGLKAKEWAPPGRARAAALRLFGPLALVAVIVLASAWREPQALTKGSNMKIMQLNWKRSLATFALLGAVNGPEAAPASAQPHEVPALTSPATASSKRPDVAKRAAVEAKLQEIVLPELVIDGLPLSEVIRHLSEQSTKKDPEKEGINFLFDPNAPLTSGPPPAVIDPTTGLPVPAGPAEQVDISSIMIKFSLPLRHVTLKEALDAIMRVADHPIHYAVEDYGVLISMGRQNVAEAPSSAPSSGALEPLSGSKRAAVEAKLQEIVLDQLAIDGLPLSEAIRHLSDEALKRDREKEGINFLFDPNTPPPATTGAIDPTTGLPVAAPAEQIDVGSIQIKFNLPLHKVTLKEALDAIMRVAERPIHYSVKDYGVLISLGPETGQTVADARSSALSSAMLARLESMDVEEEAELAREEEMLKELKDLQAKNFDKLVETIPTAVQDPLLSSLLEKCAVARQKLSDVEKEFGPEHAEVIKAKSSLAEYCNQITNRVDGILEGLKTKIEAQKAFVDQLKAKIERARHSVVGAAETQIVSRAYKMDTNTLAKGMHHAFDLNLEHMSGSPQQRALKVQSAFRDLFGRFAINLAPDRLFYNYVSGVLLVRATPEETIAAVVETLGGHEANSAASAGGLSFNGAEPRAGNP